MTVSLAYGVAIALVILVAQWSSLKKASKATRWMCGIFLGIHLLIWGYLSLMQEHVRPALVLEAILNWFSPV
ncbi:hypothetical protein [Ammoniphilus sp. YIM 78166]|uniref:hypothetical protein n=1 Tax=Ammoniphilus sp. YIM 78166 TaxID=1644106 RepID=UPI0010700F4B|nr:hypothetical protein [Ammoniphilus sp. YIM 78166]